MVQHDLSRCGVDRGHPRADDIQGRSLLEQVRLDTGAQRDMGIHVEADRILHDKGTALCPPLRLQKQARTLAPVYCEAGAE